MAKQPQLITDQCDGCGTMVKHLVDSTEPLTAMPLPEGWFFWQGEYLCGPCKKTKENSGAPASDGAAT